VLLVVDGVVVRGGARLADLALLGEEVDLRVGRLEIDAPADCGEAGDHKNDDGDPPVVARERLREAGRHDERDDAGELDEDVERRSAGVLKRVADGVAGDDGGVERRALAAEARRAALDVLLRVVPRAAGVGHHDGEQDAGRRSRRRACPPSAHGPKPMPTIERRDERNEAGQHHFAERRLGGDV
jgi:hypothetical protein